MVRILHHSLCHGLMLRHLRHENSQFMTIFLEHVEKAFADLDRAHMAHAQLHKLKMTPGNTAEDYMAQFEMLAGRTGFNDAVLEDIYVWGLSNSILQNIFAQVTLPKGLEAWKMVIQKSDCLHQSLMELKQSTGQMNQFVKIRISLRHVNKK